MGANALLIRGEKDLGASRSFNKAGDIAAENIQKHVAAAQGELEARKKALEASNAIVGDYMDKIPEGGDLPKVPEHLKGITGEWLAKQRDTYAKSARALKDLDPQSTEYMDHVNTMNTINASVENLNNQFNSFKTFKANYMLDRDENNISLANDKNSLDFTARAITDNTAAVIQDDGQLMFDNNGTSIGLNDFPKIVGVESEIRGKLITASDTFASKGEELIPGSAKEKLIKGKLYSLIKSKGINGVRSLAADPTFGDDAGGLGIPDSLLYDNSKSSELTDAVVNSWLEIIRSASADVKVRKEKQAAQAILDYRAKHPKTTKRPLYSLDAIVVPIDPSKQN